MLSKGFSLVELSISIVIIAILLAAVMKGQNLVAEARLQAVVAEVTQNKVALTSFYNKYGKYPGDFNEAASSGTASTGNWDATKTKDGDGDGQIEFINTAAIPVYEGYRAWQHLYYAGMVDVPYLGTQTTAVAMPGTDVPVSKIGGGYLLDYGQYGMSNKNIMVLGVPVTTSVSPVLAKGTMTPSQAMSLDVKMDDGNPIAGAVRGADGNGSTAGTCVAIATTKIYQVTLTGKDCILVVKASD